MSVEIWVHGAPARDIEQIMSYLTGDAHARSKVELFEYRREANTVMRDAHFKPFIDFLDIKESDDV